MALPNVSPRQLEYLVAIAETGGITAAADRCHVSQSAVSLAIGELERALEVRLVLRGSRRGTRLTPAGQQVVTDARKVLAALSELGAGARSLGQDLEGQLTIGCYAPIAPFHLPAAIAGFRSEQPQVEIQFTEGTLPEVQRDLLDGRCELAFLYQQNLQPGIEYAVLHDRPPSVLLPTGSSVAAPARSQVGRASRRTLCAAGRRAERALLPSGVRGGRAGDEACLPGRQYGARPRTRCPRHRLLARRAAPAARGQLRRSAVGSSAR